VNDPVRIKALAQDRHLGNVTSGSPETCAVITTEAPFHAVAPQDHEKAELLESIETCRARSS
jgi:hypothetical protein